MQIAPGAIVCVEAEVRGDVKIGTRTIVHPCAKILATDGPIVIGESNIIEEMVVIENRSKETLHIGNNNVFEVGAKVTAKSVGEGNLFEMKCVIGDGVVVGNSCTFGAGTKLYSPFVIEENSVFFGNPIRHRISSDKPPPHALQIDFLTRVLPNYHHVKTTIKKPVGAVPISESQLTSSTSTPTVSK